MPERSIKGFAEQPEESKEKKLPEQGAQEAEKAKDDPELTPKEKWEQGRRWPEFGRRWAFWAPEHIEDHYGAKLDLFWMPTRRDVEKILSVAITVHGGKEGVIRILDVGGGGGFLDKLLVDVAREHGVYVKCVVIDPAVDVVREARTYYEEKKETDITFVEGRIPEHPEIAEQAFDVVLNSWMWGDLRKDIQSISAKARVFIADRLGATGSGVDAEDEGGDSYLPEPGFQDFGSWQVIDHASIREAGYHDKVTTCATLVQLSDQMVLEHGGDLERQLKEIDAKPDEQLKRFPWEESLERATETYLSQPVFVNPNESKRSQKHHRKMREWEKQYVALERNLKWWKFRRGGTGDWKKRYVPSSE